jgi:hypothetical protein
MSATSTNTKTLAQPAAARPVEAPPFWELEDLIAQGRTLDEALAIMISRRHDGLEALGGLEALPERSREIPREWSDQGVLHRTALSA